MRMITDAEPDEQVKAAGNDTHVFGLRQRPDRIDDLAKVHAWPGGDRYVHDNRITKRRPVDVNSVAADNAVALQPGQAIGDCRGRHLDGAGESALRLPRV